MAKLHDKLMNRIIEGKLETQTGDIPVLDELSIYEDAIVVGENKEFGRLYVGNPNGSYILTNTEDLGFTFYDAEDDSSGAITYAVGGGLVFNSDYGFNFMGITTIQHNLYVGTANHNAKIYLNNKEFVPGTKLYRHEVSFTYNSIPFIIAWTNTNNSKITSLSNIGQVNSGIKTAIGAPLVLNGYFSYVAIDSSNIYVMDYAGVITAIPMSTTLSNETVTPL